MICTTVIPTIGRETLERAIKSALAQGLGATNHEIVIVNDSGQELSIPVELCQNNVRVITTNRSGESMSTNVGFAAALGKYVNVLHDDDSLLPGGLRALLDCAESNQAAWVAGGYELVNRNDQFTSNVIPNAYGNVFGLLMVGESFHISSLMVKREAFFHAGGCDPALDGYVDWDLECRLARIYPMYSVKYPVARIRASVVSRENPRYTQERRRELFLITREKALSEPGAASHVISSIGNDPFKRGRASRRFAASGLTAISRGRLLRATERVFDCIRIASLNIIYPDFWRGLTYRMTYDDSGIRVSG